MGFPHRIRQLTNHFKIILSYFDKGLHALCIKTLLPKTPIWKLSSSIQKISFCSILATVWIKKSHFILKIWFLKKSSEVCILTIWDGILLILGINDFNYVFWHGHDTFIRILESPKGLSKFSFSFLKHVTHRLFSNWLYRQRKKSTYTL